MTYSADPDQVAEANWAGPTLFAKAGHIWVRQHLGQDLNVKAYLYASPPPPPQTELSMYYVSDQRGVCVGTYFGADPIGVGVTHSCLHSILWTSGWVLTKFSWIYNWDITKNWLHLKVRAVEKKKKKKKKKKKNHGGVFVFSENSY